MKDDTRAADPPALPQRKVRTLGHLLLVIACLGILASILLIWFTIDPTELPEDQETTRMMDELLLPEGITAEMTVLDLIERDRSFFKDNAGYYQSYSFLAIAFFLATALIFLRLALGWRRAEPFGRSTIMGLRWLGLLLIIQFVVGWALDFALPRSGHDDLLLYNAIYETPIQMLYTGPILSTGLMLLILSWVLDYGRKIKEEQALTV